MEYLIAVGVILLVALFILPSGKRPDRCTCKSYNWLYQGPVNDCPIHKHYMDE